jgi:hypothetical protein
MPPEIAARALLIRCETEGAESFYRRRAGFGTDQLTRGTCSC